MAWTWKWFALDTRGRLDLPGLILQLNQRFPKLSRIVEEIGQSVQTVQTFPSGQTTPSVYGASLWKTNNAVAQNITGFDDGLEGQEIIVWAGDANTTIVHSASLFLKGGVSVTLTANEARRFATADGANWREV